MAEIDGKAESMTAVGAAGDPAQELAAEQTSHTKGTTGDAAAGIGVNVPQEDDGLPTWEEIEENVFRPAVLGYLRGAEPGRPRAVAPLMICEILALSRHLPMLFGKDFLAVGNQMCARMGVRTFEGCRFRDVAATFVISVDAMLERMIECGDLEDVLIRVDGGLWRAAALPGTIESADAEPEDCCTPWYFPAPPSLRWPISVPPVPARDEESQS